MKRAREDFKTYKHVFDEYTINNLNKLSGQKYFDELSSPIAMGKEANIFTAKKGESCVIVKIYRLETCDFNKMYSYIKADVRYPHIKKKKRQVIFAWAQREYRNLHLLRNIGVRVPTPYTFVDNIIVMEMVGRDSPSPQLLNEVPENKKKFFLALVDFMKKMDKAGIVHGDLSEFNILNYDDCPVLIDLSQGTTKGSPNYEELLERDIKNVTRYFKKIGFDASNLKELIKA